MKRLAFGLLGIALAPELVLADHPIGGLRAGPMNPVLAAVVWGVVALLVALVVVMIVMVFTRGESRSES